MKLNERGRLHSLTLRAFDENAANKKEKGEVVSVVHLPPSVSYRGINKLMVLDRSLRTSHPIQRCPNDILMYIFEIAVEDCIDSILIATSFSHVCHHWRETALTTPRLWAKIGGDMKLSPGVGNFDSRWKRMRRRVMGAPVNLTVSADVLPRGHLWEFLRLNEVHHFGCFHLQGGILSDHSLRSLRFAPDTRLDTLEFKVRPDNSKWSCGTLLTYFPAPQNLILNAFPQIMFERGPVYPRMTRLKVKWVDTLDLASLFAIFPQLEELEIAGTCIRNYETGAVRGIPHLRRLKIDITDQNWLTHISCPNLVEFSTGRTTPVDVALKFISSHPSINSLRFWHLNHGAELAMSAPQIEHLAITPHIWKADPELLSLPRFPQLRYLTIYDFGNDLTTDQFQTLVWTRCLPSSHPQSRLALSTNCLWRLKVLIGAHVRRDTIEWQKDQLYAMAKRNVGNDSDFPLYVCYTCSWL